MPQPPPVTLQRSFSGRYNAKPSDAAAAAPGATDAAGSLPRPGAQPPTPTGLLPPTNLWGTGAPPSRTVTGVTPTAKHSFGGAVADDGDEDENPYLEDTPYYLASLKGKAEGAKAEVLATGDKLSASDRRAALAASGRPEPGQSAVTQQANLGNSKEPGRYAAAAGRSRSPRAKLGYEADGTQDLEVDAKGAPVKRRGDHDHPQPPEPPALVSFEQDAAHNLKREPFAVATEVQCRDGVWACFFLTHLAIIVLLAVARGVPEYTIYVSGGGGGGNGAALKGHAAHGRHAADDDHGWDASLSPAAAAPANPGGALAVCLISAATAGCCALGLLEVALVSPTAMIQFGLAGLVVALSAIACSMVVAGPDLLGALFFALAASVAVCFAVSVQDRVPFAAANLGAAAAAVKKHRQTVTVAVGALFLQFVWLLVWLAAVVGSAMHNHRSRQDHMPAPSPNYILFEDQQAGRVDDDVDDHRSAGLNWYINSLGKTSPQPATSGGGGSGGGKASSGGGKGPKVGKSDKMGDDGRFDVKPTTMGHPDHWNGASPLSNSGGDRKHANSGHHGHGPLKTSSDKVRSLVSRLLRKHDDDDETFAPSPFPSTASYGYAYYDDGLSGGSSGTSGSTTSGGASNIGGASGGSSSASGGDWDDDDFDEHAAGGLVDALAASSARMGKKEASEYYGLGDGCRSILVDDRYNDKFYPPLRLANDTVGVFCACEGGGHVSGGACDNGDFFGAEWRAHFWTYVLLLVSLYWGGQVLAGVVHVTSSGTVASWWFGSDGFSQAPSNVAASAAAASAGGATPKKGAYSALEQGERDDGDSEEEADDGKGMLSPGGTGAAGRRAEMHDKLAAFQAKKEGEAKAKAKERADEVAGLRAVRQQRAMGNGVGGGLEGGLAPARKPTATGKAQGGAPPGSLSFAFFALFGGEVSVVAAALNRACGPSFGSVCLGALFVAVVSTLETVLRYVRNTCYSRTETAGEGSNVCCLCVCCLDCALGCLRDVMEYFNRWAFTYVAVYGDSFKSAGRSTHALFKRRGWSNLVTDTVCATALTYACLAVAIVVGIVAFFLAGVMGCKGVRFMVVVASTVTAYMMCSAVTSVLDAGVLTVTVCFADDPLPCQLHHPADFSKLVAAWQQSYGPELDKAGYGRLH